MEGVWTKIAKGFWFVSPFLLVMFLELFSFYPFHIPNMAVIRPCFALVAIYYFAVYAPWRFGMIMAFTAGLLADSLFMVPFGTYALVFVLLFKVAEALRRFLVDKPFYIVWIGFGIFALVANLLMWFAVAFVAGHFTAFLPMIVSYSILVAIYPLVSFLCFLLLKLLLKVNRYE